jgi:hypothetical protein
MNVFTHPAAYKQSDFIACSCTSACRECNLSTLVPAAAPIDPLAAAALLCEKCQRGGQCGRSLPSTRARLVDSKPDAKRLAKILRAAQSDAASGLSLVKDDTDADDAINTRDHLALQGARRAEIWFRQLPPRLRRIHADFDPPDANLLDEVRTIGEAVRATRRGGTPANLVIAGRPGTGKTTLAVMVATSLVLEGVVDPSAAGIVRVADLVAAATTAMPSEREDRVDALIDAKRLIVLDDLGRTGDANPKTAAPALHAIIDRLYTAEVSVIATTNLDEKALRRYLGDASYGRIVGDTPNRRVTTLDGEDRRLS